MLSFLRKIFIFLSLFSLTVFSLDDSQRISLPGAPVFSVSFGTNIYILSQENDEIYVFNTKTNKVDITISVADQPVYASIFRNKIYIQHAGSTNVTIIDPITNKIKTTSGVGNSSISSIGVGSYVYVNNFDDSLSLINPTTDLNVKTIYTRSGSASRSLFVFDNKIFIHHKTSNSISVLDTRTNTIIRNFPVGLGPIDSVKYGDFLFTLNNLSNDISITNIKSYENVFAGVGRANISVGKNPNSIVLVGDKIYVANSDDKTISVISTTTKDVIKTLEINDRPNMLLFKPPFLYSINENTLSIIDTQKDSPFKTINIGQRTTGGIFFGDTLYLYSQGDKSFDYIRATPPLLTNISTKVPDGTYKEGDLIQIEALFNQVLDEGSVLTLLLNNKVSIPLKQIVNKNLLVGTYVIGSGEDAPDLSVEKIISADIRGKYGLNNNVLVIPNKNNLGNLKNIKIVTSNPNHGDGGKCSYRLCPLTKPLENTFQYRENMICEGFISKDQPQSKRISRIEVLNIAVNMLHGPKSAATDYDDTYKDITTTGNSQETVAVVQTGLDNNLIFPNNGAFEPTKNISRIEAYALLMRGVCMKPDDSQDAARAIHQKALQNGITTKSWARFRANSAITRNEVFIVASQLADWADKNGGCDKLECRK